MNPIDVPDLQNICYRLPRLPQSVDGLSTVQSPSTMSTKGQPSHPFSSMPTEIVLQILLSLSAESIQAFRASSRAAASLELGKSFWKSHMRRHLPWLYDLPVDDIEDSERVAWGQVESFLLHITNESNPAKELALANRRRIFSVCEQIADEYWKQEATLRREEDLLGSRLQGTIFSTRMPIIASDRLKPAKSREVSTRNFLCFSCCRAWPVHVAHIYLESAKRAFFLSSYCSIWCNSR